MRGNVVLFFIFLVSSAVVRSESLPVILVSTAQIEKETSDQFYDGHVDVDVDGDGGVDGVLNFSYSRIGPIPMCPGGGECDLNSDSVLTSYLDYRGRRIHINFMCDSLGLYALVSNGMRDFYCGPGAHLVWDGENYVEYQGGR